MAMEILRSNAPQFMLKSERDVEARFTGEWNDRLWQKIPQPPRKGVPVFLPEGTSRPVPPGPVVGTFL